MADSNEPTNELVQANLKQEANAYIEKGKIAGFPPSPNDFYRMGLYDELGNAFSQNDSRESASASFSWTRALSSGTDEVGAAGEPVADTWDKIPVTTSSYSDLTRAIASRFRVNSRHESSTNMSWRVNRVDLAIPASGL